MKDKYDYVIIGGGIAGLSFANSVKNSGKNILLLERKPRYVDVNRGDTLYSHSLDILEKWGVLDKLFQKGAVKSDKISLFKLDKDIVDIKIINQNRNHNNFLLTLNHEMIEQTLYESLVNSKNVDVVLGANVVSIEKDSEKYTKLKYHIHGEEKIIFGDLFIACDGKDSLIRKNAEIDYSTIDFDHDIVILNSSKPKNYNNQSWFLFGKNHLLLIAPLPGENVRISVILKKEETSQWMKMNEAELTKSLSEESQALSDCKIKKTESHVYEIKMSLAERFNDRNLVLIGDSAHTIHPISGQGMALAISDAQILSEILSNNEISIVPQKYNNTRHDLIKSLQNHVANLGNLLISQDPLMDMARIFLLNSIDSLPLFERQIESVLQSEVDNF